MSGERFDYHESARKLVQQPDTGNAEKRLYYLQIAAASVVRAGEVIVLIALFEAKVLHCNTS